MVRISGGEYDRRPICSWPFCTMNSTERYKLPFCHEHVLYVWSVVDADLREHNLSADELHERQRQLEHQRCADHDRRGARRKQLGHIYYLRIGDSIKIGYSSQLWNRLSSYPPGTVYLATHPGSRADEAGLHSRFSAYRIAGREWYSTAHELMNHIVEMQRQHGGAPSPRAYQRRDPRQRESMPYLRE